MSRLAQLQKQLAEQEMDGLLITNPYNRRYLTGFTGTAGAAVVSSEKAFLITDFRYVEQAEKETGDFTVIEHSGPIHDTVAKVISEAGLEKIGFESTDLTYSQYTTYQKALSAEMIPAEGLVEAMRAVKSKEEISLIQEAVDIADEAFDHILSYIKPGVKEIDVANELEFFMRKKGAVSSSFDIIVASGYRSALPHGVASDKRIEEGELVTLDFGAYYKGYCSDMTRTVAVGEVNNELKDIYATVLEAQKRAVAQIRAGMTGKEADQIARGYITERGFGSYFGHGTGHGMGMEVHESPRLSKMSETVLKPGMVVTVEPGIYIAGKGGTRIEDDIVITENGNDVMTKSSKELIQAGNN
ncbi:M24 family metallopeptidase [Salisediminibacterium halotolerans]|uniref:Xaa-Pro aminopeptidase n=1 Tax=Salisediminibacterium halotolerans TaxID=517425 RepID=A0A1H9PGF2_9BACI|nr:Xaa-Pro peptidase family protein [Salisediminibacterium haloalkalitolerans]SER47302.1 Xaa-Pro aminopeptidase [Salisediminibacterium haloalkalitolerans]